MSMSNTTKRVKEIRRKTRRVRRQSIWHRLSLFLRDTLLPSLAPV